MPPAFRGDVITPQRGYWKIVCKGVLHETRSVCRCLLYLGPAHWLCQPERKSASSAVLFGMLKLGGDSKFADGVTYGGGEGGFALGLDPVSSAKAAAAYKAVKASGADVIVAPRYEVDVQDYLVYKAVNVKVTGQKGTISSIH